MYAKVKIIKELCAPFLDITVPVDSVHWVYQERAGYGLIVWHGGYEGLSLLEEAVEVIQTFADVEEMLRNFMAYYEMLN